MDPETALPTCYRHPDRETRLACSSCDRPICIECMRTASVGQKCPECAAPHGRSKVITADQIRNPGWRAAPFSYGVIAIAVVVFLVGFVVPGANQILFTHGSQINPLVALGEWWRLLTASLLHSPGSLLHIGFNMWALSIFGPPLEREVGTPSFAALYVASALAGGAAFYLLVPDGVAVGASGAVFGLFGAWLAASIRNRHTMTGRATLNNLLLLLGLNVAITFIVPRIAWQAHLGGFVAGLLIVLAWLPLADRPQAKGLRTAVAAAVGTLALLAVIAL